MKLKPCPTCGTGLDEDAALCSKCSRPDPFGKSKKSENQIKRSENQIRIFVGVAVILALAYGYFFAFPEFFTMFKQ